MISRFRASAWATVSTSWCAGAMPRLSRRMTMPIESGWATIGPFFHSVLPWKDGGRMAKPETKGERITISGRVLDAEGKPINDAMIELWQANAAGRYDHPEDEGRGELDPSFQ